MTKVAEETKETIKPKRYVERPQVKAVRATLIKIAQEYRAPTELEERYETKLRALNEIAKDFPASFPGAAKGVVDGFQIHVLAMWAQHKIEGPLTRSYFEKRIRNAESLAKMFAKKGDKSGQKKALARMKEIQAEYKDAEATGTLRA